MANDGIEFEDAVARVFEAITADDTFVSVKRNQSLIGPDGARQFDVILQASIAGESLTVIVECKDHSRPVNVTAIDAFQSKLMDFNASKGVLVARNGFSGKAIKKAARLGISLCTVNQLGKQLGNPYAAFPVICRKIEMIEVGSIRMDFGSGGGPEAGLRFDANSVISGIGMMEMVRRSNAHRIIKSDRIKIPITEELVGGPLWVSDPHGGRHFLKSSEFSFSFSGQLYAGHLESLPSALIKVDAENMHHDIIIHASDFEDREQHLAAYERFEDIPDNLRNVFLSIVLIPEKIEKIGRIKLYGRRK